MNFTGFRMIDGWGVYQMDEATLTGVRIETAGAPAFARGSPVFRGIKGQGPLVEPHQYGPGYREARGLVLDTWMDDVEAGHGQWVHWINGTPLGPGRIAVWYLGPTFPDRAAFLDAIGDVHRRAGSTASRRVFADDRGGEAYTVAENLLTDFLASAVLQLKRSAILISRITRNLPPTTLRRERWDVVIALAELALAMSPRGSDVSALALLAHLHLLAGEAVRSNNLKRLCAGRFGGYTPDGVWSETIDFEQALADVIRRQWSAP
jgi:hypothetical protein